MEKLILSLKNIYKLLMANDFPIYSESVIGERNRKGQTLLRFWQSLIAAEFRCLPYGRMIWRSDGKRNRYMSNLCNRSAQLRVYQEYAGELAQQAKPAALLSQIDRFTVFLLDKAYKHDVLLRRITELMRLLEAEDVCVSAEIAQQIMDAAQPGEWFAACGAQGRLFQAGYLLTLLTLYAAAGEAMSDPVLGVLREEACSLRALWALHSRQLERQSAQTAFLTVHAGLLQDNPLPPERFFGREEELYDLMEMASAQRKCLVSGIGGVGKTELIRQLIARCAQQRAVQGLAVVPYEGNMTESFARAFEGFHRQEPAESLRQILDRLERMCARGEKVLLVLDDVGSADTEDPVFESLAALSCGVIVTSRRGAIKGFDTFRLAPPSVSTGALIFRDNYGSPLTREDRALLQEMLRDEALCHPLTLRLMARAARSRGWSVTRLRAQLEERGVAMTWAEEERTVRLEQMYHQLYSLMQIPGDCQQLAELFTLLPRESYASEFLLRFFPEAAGEAAQLQERVEQLVQGGWLEEDETGVSMHPLIAQCLRRKMIGESRILTVFDRVITALGAERVVDVHLYQDETVQRIGRALIYAAGMTSGSVSERLMQAVLRAMSLQVQSHQLIERSCALLEQMMKRCGGQSDELEALYCTVMGRWYRGDSARCETLYRRQKEKRTVSLPVFLDFCLFGSMMSSASEITEQMIKEALCEQAHPVQKATAYYHLCLLYNHCGEFEKGREAGQLGLEYARQHPECGEDMVFNCMISQCTSDLQFGRQQEAKALLDELEARMHEDMLAMHKLQRASLAGAYELNYGSLEKALAYYEEQQALNLEYYGKDGNYYIGLGQIAIVQQRLKRFDEAIETYGVILRYAKEIDDLYMHQRFSNNAGVLYLDMGKPVEALTHLDTALEEGRKIGSIALAEALRNCARAYAMLGDAAREREYLEEGVPQLEVVYGQEHPRAAAARERLMQLKAE